MPRIAEKLSEESFHSKEDVYRKAIRECGYGRIWPVPTDAVNRTIEIWQSNGVGWIAELLGACQNIKGYSNVRVYYGSSAYDTKEMSRFIDCLVSMAKDIGVETSPQEELDELIKEWGVKDG